MVVDTMPGEAAVMNVSTKAPSERSSDAANCASSKLTSARSGSYWTAVWACGAFQTFGRSLSRLQVRSVNIAA